MSRQFNPQEFFDLLGSFTRVSTTEVTVLAACLALAWVTVRLMRGIAVPEASVWFGRYVVDGVLFPMLALALAYGARLALTGIANAAVFKLAIPILLSLVIIRLTARVLSAAFPGSRWAHIIERSVSWVAWIAVVLWVTGVLPLALDAMDAVSWKIGKSQVTLRTMIEGALTMCLVMVLALWVSAAIEKQLLKGAGEDLSIRIMAAKLLRTLLLFVGLLVALSATGLDLTALSVLGGAVGVGLGFGLQKVAASYVSGFVILAEQSLRIGDMVKVDNVEGRITDIRTRYTLIHALNGVTAIIPNELLITQKLENLSLGDPNVQKKCTVRVAYGSDIRNLQPRIVAAVAGVSRVLKHPGPDCHLANFGADGMDLNILYWIGDPENGLGNVQSDVSLTVLDVLKREGVEIPQPQRVLHQRTADETRKEI